MSSTTVSVRSSFLFSYLVLFASTMITFVESIRTKSIRARHILNLETAVSVIAAYVYMIFLGMLDRPDVSLDDITKYRYMDWFITTPMLLLALLLFFNFYNKNDLPVQTFLWVLLFNSLMLMFGYLGETKKIDKTIGSILGFLFYILMLVVIWFGVVSGSKVTNHKIVFIVFALIWTMYGVAYYLEVKRKNIMYNLLDVISKSMFGLFMWLYYGSVIAF